METKMVCSPVPSQKKEKASVQMKAMELTDRELQTALEADRGRHLYIGYIIAIALVDVSMLLLLLKLKPWVHLAITLTLGSIGVACISLSIYYSGRASRNRSLTIRRLIREIVREQIMESSSPGAT